jgi:hypothetical protein
MPFLLLFVDAVLSSYRDGANQFFRKYAPLGGQIGTWLIFFLKQGQNRRWMLLS